MADNNRIKVIGYAQRVFFNNGIEYRNFSDDLVGNQQTESDDGTGANSNFTLGNFVTTTNFEGKATRFYDTKKYSDFITLQTLDLSVDNAMALLNNNVNVEINMDKSELCNFAYFGSATEFVRVSLENIITLWPASLYMNPTRISNGNTINGFTVLDYTYDINLNKSTFSVDTNFISNKYDINYQKNGTIADTFNEGNDLRNLTANFSSYVILVDGVEYPIIGYIGSDNKLNDIIKFEVDGDPFKVVSGSNLTIKYHIKPKALLVEEFFNSLNGYESNLLNRLVVPKYTSEYNFKIESEDGLLINRFQKLTWPVSDGYNIDFSTNEYVEFVTSLLNISNSKDDIESNLMTRFLTSESISDFDTIPTCDGGVEETSGQKMNKTLKIYGREFDEIKKYIDGISFANVVTYDKKNNIPDQLVKYLARVLGWELVSSVLNEDLVSSYLTPKTTPLSGQSRGLTAQEADVEMWRRLILNSAWIWKSKGTRKAVEFFFKFIGAPDGLINFKEYVYSVKNPIDMDVFMAVLENNGLDTDLSLYNVDADGYPKFLKDTSNMYFQKGGQWYRETGGTGATQHIGVGNNPHIGPYDNGREYINQLNNIIPNFTPFTMTSTTVSTSEAQLFTNYEDGLFNQYSGDLYVDVIDTQGANFENIVTLTPSIISDPCPTPEETDCGCDVAEDDESIKIEIVNQGVCTDIIQDDIPIDTGCDVLFNDVTFDSNLDYFLFDYKVYEMDGSLSTTIKKVTEFGPRDCCLGLEVKDESGEPYFHEIFEMEGTSGEFQVFHNEPSNCGYICCLSKGVEVDWGVAGCGCILSCQWQLTHNNFYEMVTLDSHPGLRFLTFIDARGDKRIVNKADSCFCHSLTTPTIVTDPNNGDIGYGCAMAADPAPIGGNEAFDKFNDIFETYKRRANETIGCKENINTVDDNPCSNIIRVEEQEDGLVLFFFDDGTQSLVVEEECCTNLGYTPGVGGLNNKLANCRWKTVGDGDGDGDGDTGSGCVPYTMSVNTPRTHTFTYTPCGGMTELILVSSRTGAKTVCSETVPSSNRPASEYDLFIGLECTDNNGGGDGDIEPSCNTFVINVNVPHGLTFNYTDCSGLRKSINVHGDDGAVSVCAQIGPTTAASPNKYDVFIGGECQSGN